jgi:hypothetical protein
VGEGCGIGELLDFVFESASVDEVSDEIDGSHNGKIRFDGLHNRLWVITGVGKGGET